MKSFKFKLSAPLAVAAVIVTLLLMAACGSGETSVVDPTQPVQESRTSVAPPDAQGTIDEGVAAPTQPAQTNPTEAAAPDAQGPVDEGVDTTPQLTQISPEAAVTDDQGTPDDQSTIDAQGAIDENAAATNQPTQTSATPAGTPDAQSPAATATKEPEQELTYPGGSIVGGKVGQQAPEFFGIANWINSAPLTMESLRGNVVLIDFWTYTCVNCIRTLPYVRDWHAKYADKGLVIVGVHSPEFEFEKVTENVTRSAGDLGVEWAVAQDNDFMTWRAFSNRAWPAKYLIDQHGIIRYTHIGEGAYSQTEQWIRDLLEETGADLGDAQLNARPDPRFVPVALSSDRATSITRELYGGYQRNNNPGGVYVAHPEYYDASKVTLTYEDPGDHQNQLLYLQGPWTNGSEQLRHGRETRGYEDYIALRFFATSANAVIDPGGGDPFEVEVTIDGRPLKRTESGADVILEDGRSFVNVDEGRMYELVALPEFGDHELKISSNSPDFSLFAFTFGAYTEGP